jgi:hypothetical protein
VKRRAVKILPSTFVETVYETTPKKLKFEVEVLHDTDDDVSDALEEDFKDFGRKNFGEIASPNLTP